MTHASFFRFACRVVFGVACVSLPLAAKADQKTAPKRFSLHVQATNLQQYHGAYRAEYSGPQSLSASAETAKTFDATIFAGAKLWRGGEAYVNPEIDQGFGLSGTVGVAGFPSGEAYKVGAAEPYLRLQRYFVRQTFDEGGAVRRIDDGPNQVSEDVTEKRLTLTFGKFSVVDVFDNNVYAHDPRNDFMNWSIIDMGAFDYAADAWGYTRGLSAELNRANSVVRLGVFQLSDVPNSPKIESRFLRQFSPVVEAERSTSLFGGHPGMVRVLAYGNDGFMAPLADATDDATASGLVPEVANFRTAKHWKLGGGVNVEQELAPHVGAFVRASAQNGTYESFEFTEIDRSLSGGLSLDGAMWKRPGDAFGIAGALNALADPHKQYLAAGGLGILIGDGALSYAGERILETYYRAGIGKALSITADYQNIANPGYNLARGPVSVFSLRLHAAY